MTEKIKAYLLIFLSTFISVAPAVIATVSYFPLWKERGSAAVLSGFTLALLIIAAAPFLKFIKRILSSPSIFVTWFIIFVLFLLLKSIADEMVVISFVGFVSNAIGALIYKLAERKLKKA
ncbi:MAG: hypothetical protein IJY23_06635 [Clostridia bacterium]|nr:hypothetical protein [Clostridia bacterium]